ncbi:actin-related protein Arp23 like WD 40 repeate protein [Cryptosporidium ryanae]|uniref:actin-related protein Arp23 like WD 40 repeate protein n=1 Tax=Cryptosporidium ryanae TaxID=515981 RepID=UPI00351A4C8F|nr:actin-related protein Arp23 like WD 40 repeate protein [Cryptosporidium ryanae]
MNSFQLPINSLLISTNVHYLQFYLLPDVSIVSDNKDIYIYHLESGFKPNNAPLKLSKHRNNISSIDWSLLPKSYCRASDKSIYSQLLSVGEDLLVINWILKESNCSMEIVTQIINTLQSDCYPLSCKFSSLLDNYCKFAISTTSGDVFIFNSRKIMSNDDGVENNHHLVANGYKHLNIIEFGNLLKFEQLKISISELPLTCINWSGDDRFLVCGGIENKGLILHISSNNEDCEYNEFDLKLISSIDAQNSILACSISPKNNLIVFTDRDSNIYFTEISKSFNCISDRLKWEGLPFFNLKFIGDKTIVGVGYDCIPVIFTQISGCIWQHAKNLNSSILPPYLNSVWLSNFDPMKHYEPNTIHKRPIIDVFPKDQKTLVCFGCDGKYSFWDF